MGLLQHDEHNRLTIEEILNHPYIQKDASQHTKMFDNGFNLVTACPSFNSRDSFEAANVLAKFRRH